MQFGFQCDQLSLLCNLIKKKWYDLSKNKIKGMDKTCTNGGACGLIRYNVTSQQIEIITRNRLITYKL